MRLSIEDVPGESQRERGREREREKERERERERERTASMKSKVNPLRHNITCTNE